LSAFVNSEMKAAQLPVQSKRNHRRNNRIGCRCSALGQGIESSLIMTED
jgi:hypothetical protein